MRTDLSNNLAGILDVFTAMEDLVARLYRWSPKEETIQYFRNLNEHLHEEDLFLQDEECSEGIRLICKFCSDQEIKDAVRLAHGEYLAIVDKFGSQKPYTNIISAEETHLAYLKEVYLSYGLDFPADDSANHIVVPADLLEAAETGVQAEIDNIAMYEHFLTYDLPDNVREVFSALKSGSESHLSAFQKQVDKLK